MVCMTVRFLAVTVDVDFKMISEAGMSISPAVLYLFVGRIRSYPKGPLYHVTRSSKPDVTFLSLVVDFRRRVYMKR